MLLDELEALGALGERCAEVRTRINTIARLQQATWARHPEVVVTDFYAWILDLPALEPSRARWRAELDRRGPWLRALRPRAAVNGPEAELRSDDDCDLCTFGRPRFLTEERVALEPRAPGDIEQRCIWAWAEGGVEVEDWEAGEDSGAAGSGYPRFERGESAPVLLRTADSQPEPLPWPEFGHAYARSSVDGRRTFVYGWYEDYCGLVYVLDGATLEIEREIELDNPASEVFDRPDSDELLIVTYREVIVLNGNERWTLEGSDRAVAWSPSGRYLCVVDTGVAQIWDRSKPRQRQSTAGLPLCFSPDGARLVDGDVLLDGHTGVEVARLGVQLGNYLEGGAAMPWCHVGTELIVCIHGGLALWRTATGEAVDAGDLLHAHHWDCIAYDRSGTRYALAHEGTREVAVGALPSIEEVAQVSFEVDAELLAISPGAELIAVIGEGRVEVRRLDGTLVYDGEDRRGGEDRSFRRARTTLRFSADARTLSCHDPSDGSFRVWLIDDSDEAGRDQPAELPPGWSIDAGPITRIVHELGVQIFALYDGPWLVNPSAPRILACPGGLLELRGT